MHTCETCGNEWPENYCPECGHTIGKAAKPAVPPPLPPPLPTPKPPATPTRMFGLFKKRQPAATPPVCPPLPPLPAGGLFWNEMGMGRLVPDYIQLHLASRSPQHTMSRRADGGIDTDAVPPLIFNDPQIRGAITRLITEQLPNNPSVLSSLTSDEIVSRLCGILTKVTGKDMYAVVCRKWCLEHKLL